MKKSAEAKPNHLLRAARKERGWTQKEVADRIGASLSLNVSRWESGATFPSAYYVEKLCVLFGKSARELGLLQPEKEIKSEATPQGIADFSPIPLIFLPTGGEGHILLTTRASATGNIAPSVALEKMNSEEGSLLLLRRAKRLSPHAQLAEAETSTRAQAQVIVQVLDGLPLVLDQAGAYIEETSCGLAGYLELY